MKTSHIGDSKNTSYAFEKLLVCPSCKGSLHRRTDRFTCVECGRNYPILADDIIDFTPDLPEVAACWDEEAEVDEIHAAAAVAKSEAADIFVKLPPILSTGGFDSQICIDLGCGYGRTLIYSNLIAHPRISIGIDISVLMLKKAREYSHQYGINPILIRADISSLPLQSAEIDIVYSSAVLLHLPKQKVQDVIRETVRVLKGGGRAIFENSFPGWLNPDGFQTRLTTALRSRWLKPAWVRTYTYREINELFTSTGYFGLVDIQPEGYKVLPKALLKYSLPTAIKKYVNSTNESVSKRLHFNNLFVSGWTIRAHKSDPSPFVQLGNGC